MSSKAAGQRSGRGFRTASSLLDDRVRKAGQSRGFAVMRLLTHWPEIVGQDLARHARPGKVHYGKGFGATLTLVCSGAAAPIVQMQSARILEKVNACYGYAAISRIRVVQTAPEGFADEAAPFQPAPSPDPQAADRAREMTAEIADPDLRAALDALARNVLSRRN